MLKCPRIAEGESIIILVYMITGALVGLLSGLFGIGGGIIMVPVLIKVYEQMHLSPEVLTHLAAGTSLATISITSLVSAVSQWRRRAVELQVLWVLGPTMLVSAFFGAKLASQLPGHMIQWALAAVLLVMALLLQWHQSAVHHEHVQISTPRLVLAGIVGGLIAGFLGIGGGLLLVPFLLYQGLSMQRASGTVAWCTLFAALAGTCGVILSGWSVVLRPSQCIGFVYLPAVFSIAAVSMLFAPIGVRLGHFFSQRLLKQLFGGLLILVAIDLVV